MQGTGDGAEMMTFSCSRMRVLHASKVMASARQRRLCVFGTKVMTFTCKGRICTCHAAKVMAFEFGTNVMTPITERRLCVFGAAKLMTVACKRRMRVLRGAKVMALALVRHMRVFGATKLMAFTPVSNTVVRGLHMKGTVKGKP
jgi:hypothetical protein